MVLNIRYNTVEAAFDEMSQEQECFLFLHLVTLRIPSKENKQVLTFIENKQVLTCITSAEIHRKV